MADFLGDFHFLRPLWLLLLLAIPLVIYLVARSTSTSKAWREVLSPELFNALIEGSSAKSIKRGYWLPSLVILVAALGLAGPAYERLPQPVEVKQDPLVIVLDLTLSMNSQDVSPTRIHRAKFKVTDLLRGRDEGLTALVAYAGDAYVVTPLTQDTNTIQNLLNSLSPDMMPVRGSNVTVAIERATDLLANQLVANGRILLVTDGIEDFSTLQDVIDDRYPISVLGVGSTNTDITPNSNVFFDEFKLRDFATATGGRYSTVSIDDQDLANLLAPDLLGDTERLDDILFDDWHDLGYLLILPLALVLAFLTRKGALLCLFLVVGVQPLKAGWLEDLWITKERQAVEAYRNGDFITAESLFEESNSNRADYNRANSVAMTGALENAIAAYDQILDIDPDHEDANYNRQLLLDFLEQQQQEQQGAQGQDNQEGQENQSQSGEGSGESGEQDQQSTSESQDQSEIADAEESQSQSGSEGSQEEEQQQASATQPPEEESDGNTEEVAAAQPQEGESQEERELREIHERWLRRLPDDPGILLRRKFDAESNARISDGTLDKRDVGPAW